MITLKELVERQKWTDESDIDIIREFFYSNDLEEEGIELIYDITKEQTRKLKNRLKVVKDWTSYLPSKYLYETYDLDTADQLHTLELDYITNGELSNKRFIWAKKNVPNIVRPQVYFNPLVDWLEERGVKFKNQI